MTDPMRVLMGRAIVTAMFDVISDDAYKGDIAAAGLAAADAVMAMCSEQMEDAVATVSKAVLDVPADWPGPEREQEWAEHIARAAVSALMPGAS